MEKKRIDREREGKEEARESREQNVENRKPHEEYISNLSYLSGFTFRSCSIIVTFHHPRNSLRVTS